MVFQKISNIYTPNDPDCLNWNVVGTLNIDGDFFASGMFCGSGGGKAGIIFATLTKSDTGNGDGGGNGGDDDDGGGGGGGCLINTLIN